MAQMLGLFLRNFARNGDVPEVIASSTERQHVSAFVGSSIPAIERLNAPVGQNGDGNRTQSRAGGDAGEPRPESFRTCVSATLLDHAYPETQTCPPFPVNDS